MKSGILLDLDHARATEMPKYVPAHTKNGREISAKCFFNAVVNKPAIERDGRQVKEATKVFVTIGGWGNMADTLAKTIKKGKVFSCKCAVDTFQRVQKRKNAGGDWIPATHDDGSVVTNTAFGYTVVPGSLNIGEDSAKQIADEIVAGDRPVGWNGQIPTDMVKVAMARGELEDLLAEAENGPAAWSEMCKAINTSEYKGGKKFANANVVAPNGDNIELKYPIDGPAAPPAPPRKSGEPTVDGFTYQQYKDAGWSDEDLLADESKKVLVAHKVGPKPPEPEETAAEETVDETDSDEPVETAELDDDEVEAGV